MNTFYSAYTKQVQGTKFYFVKKFSTFPEIEGMPDMLESFGMHPDFKTACKIAKVADLEIQRNLLESVENSEADQGKIIHITSLGLIKAAQ
ncbi:MAG: hypothetical protein ABIN25_12945 [Ginsengibacter sp.]